MDAAVNALRAFADPMRIRILALLRANKSLCVCQISAALRMPYATLSKHLQMMKLTGLVSDEKKGKWVYYSLSDSSWNPIAPRLIGLVSEIAEQSPDIFKEDQKNAQHVRCCDLSAVAKLGPRFLSGNRVRSQKTTTGERK